MSLAIRSQSDLLKRGESFLKPSTGSTSVAGTVLGALTRFAAGARVVPLALALRFRGAGLSSSLGSVYCQRCHNI